MDVCAPVSFTSLLIDVIVGDGPPENVSFQWDSWDPKRVLHTELIFIVTRM